MISFQSWIISIAGASVIFSLFDNVLPVGKMGEFSRSIVSIFYSYVIIYPIVDFLINLL